MTGRKSTCWSTFINQYIFPCQWSRKKIAWFLTHLYQLPIVIAEAGSGDLWWGWCRCYILLLWFCRKKSISILILYSSTFKPYDISYILYYHNKKREKKIFFLPLYILYTEIILCIYKHSLYYTVKCCNTTHTPLPSYIFLWNTINVPSFYIYSFQFNISEVLHLILERWFPVALHFDF